MKINNTENTSSNIKLSVVIPAYNEAKNLDSGALDAVYNYLKKQDYSYEVLIVDDGSQDNTADLVEKIVAGKKGFKLIRNTHGGKAVTVMTGLLESHGEVVAFTDMDQATPLPEIEKFFPKFEEGADVVIGSRSGRKGAPLIRKINAFGFVVCRTIILGLPFSDTQCGFKAFTQKAIKDIFPKMLKRWKQPQVSGAAVNAAFDVELLFLSRKAGLKIVEVPVSWHHVGTERFNFLKEAFEALGGMAKIRINDIQKTYD